MPKVSRKRKLRDSPVPSASNESILKMLEKLTRRVSHMERHRIKKHSRRISGSSDASAASDVAVSERVSTSGDSSGDDGADQVDLFTEGNLVVN